MFVRRLPLSLGLLIFSGPVAAASFDCPRAADGIERAICGDPALSRSDEVIAERYRSALKTVSTDGRTALRDNQRAFLRYRQNCAIGGVLLLPRQGETAEKATACLKTLYDDRDKTLANAARRAGGHVFLTLTTYRAQRVAPSDDGQPPRVTETQTLVQIDSPRTAFECAWNAMMRAWLAKKAESSFSDERSGGYAGQTSPGDAEIDEDVAGASGDFISASLGSSAYLGGAHGIYTSEIRNWSLRYGRAVGAADIFRKPADPGLNRLVARRYQNFNNGQHEGCDDPNVATAKALVNADGIDFGFDPYELGAYICGGDAKMSWAELAPYLKARLPFDRKRLQTPAP